MYCSSRRAIDLLLKLARFIKNDSYRKVQIKDFDNIFDEVLELLFQHLHFKLKDSYNSDNIENALKEYLNNLKKQPYYESSPEELSKEISSIKPEKISFWEAILDEYLEHKDKYNLELRKKIARHNKQTDEIKKKITSGYYTSFLEKHRDTFFEKKPE